MRPNAAAAERRTSSVVDVGGGPHGRRLPAPAAGRGEEGAVAVTDDGLAQCAYRPVFASNPPSDAIKPLVQPTKVFRVSKFATFARG
jgi:hypothetical protein